MAQGTRSSTDYGHMLRLFFDGQQEQFRIWETRFTNYWYTLDKGVYKALLPKPQGEDADDEDFEDKNRRAYAELVQVLDERSLQIIMTDNANDGRGAFQTLKAHYDSIEKPHVLTLYEDLTTLHMREPVAQSCAMTTAQRHPPKYKNAQRLSCGKHRHTSKECQVKSHVSCNFCRKQGHIEEVCFAKKELQSRKPRHNTARSATSSVVMDLPDIENLTESVTIKIHLAGMDDARRDTMEEAKILQNMRKPSVFSTLYSWVYGLIARSSDYVLKLFKVKRGSTEIVIVSDSPKAIRELKQKVQDGVLTKELKEILLTDDVLRLAKGAPVDLKVEVISYTIKQAKISPVDRKRDNVIMDILGSLTKGMKVTAFNKGAAVKGGIAGAIGGFLVSAVGLSTRAVGAGFSAMGAGSTVVAAAGATVGGLALSVEALPLMAVAAVTGAVVGLAAGSFKKTTVLEVISQLPEDQKLELVGRVQKIVGEWYSLDKPDLPIKVLSNDNMKTRIVGNLKEYFKEELSQEITDSDSKMTELSEKKIRRAYFTNMN